VSGLPSTLAALYLEYRGRDRWGVNGGIQDEDKTLDSPNQLTVTMFSVIGLQLLELQIPVFLVRLDLGIEIKSKTDFVELPFSFLIYFAISGACALIADPMA
jgi:hypothetical protein